uniref:DUF4939 domain-containing protein n=1 Tax=Terrapene triunguis TaxID=2587831 RepID=A0A674ICE8_9SAUR
MEIPSGRVLVQAQAAVPVPPILASTSCEPNVPLPDKFNGDRVECHGFLNQFCFLLMFLLSGETLKWVSLLLEMSNPFLEHFENFVQAMAGICLDPHWECTAEAILHAL